MCEYENWVCSAAFVSFGCSSEPDAVEGAVNSVLKRIDIEELNEGNIFGDIVWRNGGLSCEVERRDEFRDPNSGIRAGRCAEVTRMPKCLGNIEKPKKGDAKMS